MTSRKPESSSSDNLSEIEWKRKHGYEMLREGKKRSVIAAKLGVDRKTVYNWSMRMEKGIDWKNRKQKGAKSRLSPEQKGKLKKIIDSGPGEYGYDTDIWTLKRIAEVIQNEFGVEYNTTYVWQILRAMNYSAQMPLATAMEKNPEYVESWLRDQYPEYLKEAQERKALILFLDESGMQSRPNVRRTWAPRGERPKMRVCEKRDKISIVSAVSTEGDLFFAISEESMNEDHIILFLEQLLREIGSFIYIFWDNITIHRSRKVKQFLFDRNERLTTRRIPPYSPELNPDEIVWNVLKYQELPNFCPDSLEELKSTAVKTLNMLKSDPERLRSAIRASALPLPA